MLLLSLYVQKDNVEFPIHVPVAVSHSRSHLIVQAHQHHADVLLDDTNEPLTWLVPGSRSDLVVTFNALAHRLTNYYLIEDVMEV